MNNEYRIVVDAGHGGSDPGAVSGNLKEKDFTLKAANYMYDRFKELGIPVVITRDTDETLTRKERLNTMTNTFGNDEKVLVLSNHINSGGGEGAEVVYPLRTQSTLPKAILDEIGAKGQIKRKIYQRVLPENPSKDYYYIMRETPNTTALLIEYGFIDNPNDQKKLQNNLLDYVEGVVKAVSEYTNTPYSLPGSNQEGDYYTVKFGDTLYSIANKYNTSVNELKRLNNLNSNNLTIGQKLQIPKNEIQEDYITYTVKLGDTLYSIAKNYNITPNDIIEYNNLPTTVLTVNQTLKIPTTQVNPNTYVVKSGDTLYSIAQSFNTTVTNIKDLNNLYNNNLTIGQELIIPRNDITEVDYVVYQVKRGDTLYSIAKEYNTKVSSIKSYNNLTSDTLTIGDILQIPIEETKTEYQIYKVNSNDTLYSIANKFNTTVQKIIDLNNLTSTLLNINQELKIPSN